MRRTYCDSCGVEITAANEFYDVGVKVRDTRFTLYRPEVEDGPMQDICKHCVIDKIAELDDRPRERPEEPR